MEIVKIATLSQVSDFHFFRVEECLFPGGNFFLVIIFYAFKASGKKKLNFIFYV